MIARKIREGKIPAKFPAHYIYRKGWSGLDRESTERGLETLEAYGWVLSVTALKAGREVTSWVVLPSLLRGDG